MDGNRHFSEVFIKLEGSRQRTLLPAASYMGCLQLTASLVSFLSSFKQPVVQESHKCILKMRGHRLEAPEDRLYVNG